MSNHQQPRSFKTHGRIKTTHAKSAVFLSGEKQCLPNGAPYQRETISETCITVAVLFRAQKMELQELSPLKMSPVRDASGQFSPALLELSPLKFSPLKSSPIKQPGNQGDLNVAPATEPGLVSHISNSCVSVFGSLRSIGHLSHDVGVGFGKMHYKGWHSGPKSERRNVQVKCGRRNAKTAPGILAGGIRSQSVWNAEVAMRGANGSIGEFRVIAMRDLVDNDDSSMCTDDEWQQVLQQRAFFERSYATLLDKNVTSTSVV